MKFILAGATHAEKEPGLISSASALHGMNKKKWIWRGLGPRRVPLWLPGSCMVWVGRDLKEHLVAIPTTCCLLCALDQHLSPLSCRMWLFGAAQRRRMLIPQQCLCWDATKLHEIKPCSDFPMGIPVIKFHAKWSNYQNTGTMWLW